MRVRELCKTRTRLGCGPILEFSIKLRSRILDLSAGNESYCRRIEASAQEKLGAAGAFGGIRAGAAAEAAS